MEVKFEETYLGQIHNRLKEKKQKFVNDFYAKNGGFEGKSYKEIKELIQREREEWEIEEDNFFKSLP